MNITNYISTSFPTVDPFTGVNSIEDALLDQEYMVVINDRQEYQGILTPCDLIKRPYKIVIDCLTEKGCIFEDDTVASALIKFNETKCPALPVFRNDLFIGIIDKQNLVSKLEFRVHELYDQSLISEKLKTSILQNLSHEIRTPLNGILGFLEIISELDLEDFKTEGQEHFNMVQTNADRFLLIMHDLIDLALMDAGQDFKIEQDHVRVEGVFQDLKEYFDRVALILNKDISVQYISQDPSLSIISDKRKIRHILYHLIDNAVKFSEDKKVLYGYNLDENNITFFVRNKGPQINDDTQNRIFGMFEKLDPFDDKCISGLGIGLHMVKKLSELLNGKIELVSDEKQTTFYFTLDLNTENMPCEQPVFYNN